jgi:hypothetical protein
MSKILLSAAVVTVALFPSLAFSQCSEVPYQGFMCNSLMSLKGGLELPNATTVAGLSAFPCNAGAQGQLRVVSDATTPAYNGTLTGGGAVVTMALCNGTAWVAH